MWIQRIPDDLVSLPEDPKDPWGSGQSLCVDLNYPQELGVCVWILRIPVDLVSLSVCV